MLPSEYPSEDENNAESNFTVLATPVGENKLAISVSPNHRNSRATSLPLLRHSLSLCLQSYTTFVDKNLYFVKSASFGNLFSTFIFVSLSISCALDTPSTFASSSPSIFGGPLSKSFDHVGIPSGISSSPSDSHHHSSSSISASMFSNSSRSTSSSSWYFGSSFLKKGSIFFTLLAAITLLTVLDGSPTAINFSGLSSTSVVPSSSL